MASDWATVLDVMEKRVVSTDRMLAGEDVTPQHFALPADLGPLPPALRERAQSVLQATLEVEGRLSGEMKAVGSRLRHVTSSRIFGSGRPNPTYVDRSV